MCNKNEKISHGQSFEKSCSVKHGVNLNVRNTLLRHSNRKLQSSNRDGRLTSSHIDVLCVSSRNFVLLIVTSLKLMADK